MKTPTAVELIKLLDLAPHPEGGWYRETYRSAETLPGNALPERFSGDRSFGTAIYFLLQEGDISALHRIHSDEIWHHYAGAPLHVHIITPQGDYRLLKLGSDIASGESFQAVVPAGCWFGAQVAGAGYALVGCSVAPGFDFADFEMGNRAALLAQFPRQARIIRQLTKRQYYRSRKG